MKSFEEENLKAYASLLRIEVVLRECVRAKYEAEFGSGWRKRLPGELYKKIKESQTDENKPQFDFIRLGPLYYLSFGELLILLRQKPGQDVTLRFGGSAFLKQLENILTPRNAVCHSRPVSKIGLQAIELLYSQMENVLGKNAIEQLLANPDVGIGQAEVANLLTTLLEDLLTTLPTLPQKFPSLSIYLKATEQFWWWDDALAGFNRACLTSTVELLEEYNSLPIGVGSFGNRLKFCEQRDLRGSILAALIELKKIHP